MTARESIFGPAGDVLRAAADVAHADIRLLKAEMAEKAGGLASAAAFASTGFVLLILAGFFLLQACVILLTAQGLDPLTAHAVVGVAALGLGAVFVRSAIARFKSSTAAPQRFLREVRGLFDVGARDVP